MIDDIRYSGNLVSNREASYASCVCGCGCECVCMCICFFWINREANYNPAAVNNNQTNLNNQWMNNAVAGQGP